MKTISTTTAVCCHVKSSTIAIYQHFLTWPDLFFLLEPARLTGSSSLNMTDFTPLGHDTAARRDLSWGRTGRDPTGSGMACGFYRGDKMRRHDDARRWKTTAIGDPRWWKKQQIKFRKSRGIAGQV